MGQQTREEIQDEALARRERIKAFMMQDPPVPISQIRTMEGMHDRACRQLVREIDAEFEIGYLKRKASELAKTDVPYGMTSATARLRQKLGDNVYLLRERGKDSSHFGRNEVAPRIGLNNRQQKRAEERPFTHDWTISQIERLARELGRDPMEFILSCLTT